MELATAVEGYAERDWQTVEAGTVRFALVGLGWWTVDIAIPAIEGSELCETTVLVSSSREKAERLADRNGIEHGITYDEYHDGAVADAYDAVYVATPNASHLEYVETAARLDRAVLCEKPLEATVERGERLVDAAADVPLMTAYRMHTEPAARRARELIEAGFVGDPVQVHSTHSQRLLEMIPEPDQWRLDPDRTGYGTSVMDLGVYSINTTRFLLDRDPVAVSATTRSTGGAFADVPDQYASFTLTLEGGIPALCTASQDAQSDSYLKVTGTEGRVAIEPAFQGDATLRLAKGDLEVTFDDPAFGVTEEMREEFDYFADRVLSGAEILPDGRHGLADLRTIAAVHEAADRGEPVGL